MQQSYILHIYHSNAFALLLLLISLNALADASVDGLSIDLMKNHRLYCSTISNIGSCVGAGITVISISLISKNPDYFYLGPRVMQSVAVFTLVSTLLIAYLTNESSIKTENVKNNSYF